jgi:long-subunit fatty acid transport protein
MIRTVVALLAVCASASAQDFQVGARAKAMGGSYTAFGDDPVAVWTNPAGTATQPTQLAITYQSFVQYEFDSIPDDVPTNLVGEAEQGLLDPPISPSFLGIVVQMGGPDLEMAASLAYVRPFQIKYVYEYNDIALGQLFTQTDQQFTRLRSSFAVSKRLSEGPGFLTQAAVGLGADYVYTKYKEIDQSPDPAAESLIYEDSESSAGWGVGLLVTAYESDAFRVDLGAAWNSGVDFSFDLGSAVYPVWDWPALASAGLAFYLGESYPLRLTADAQWIAWEETVGDPDPTLEGFDDTLSFSLGAEYRFTLSESKRLFARAGFKSYDTPWGDADELPAVGLSRLRIETKGDRVEILTLGLGFYWTRKTFEGETRMSGIDVAIELFGETEYIMAAGFTYMFD